MSNCTFANSDLLVWRNDECKKYQVPWQGEAQAETQQKVAELHQNILAAIAQHIGRSIGADQVTLEWSKEQGTTQILLEDRETAFDGKTVPFSRERTVHDAMEELVRTACLACEETRPSPPPPSSQTQQPLPRLRPLSRDALWVAMKQAIQTDPSDTAFDTFLQGSDVTLQNTFVRLLKDPALRDTNPAATEFFQQLFQWSYAAYTAYKEKVTVNDALYQAFCKRHAYEDTPLIKDLYLYFYSLKAWFCPPTRFARLPRLDFEPLREALLQHFLRSYSSSV